MRPFLSACHNHATSLAICASRRLTRHLTDMCTKKRVLFTCGHTQVEMVQSCGRSDCTFIFRLECAQLACRNCVRAGLLRCRLGNESGLQNSAMSIINAAPSERLRLPALWPMRTRTHSHFHYASTGDVHGGRGSRLFISLHFHLYLQHVRQGGLLGTMA